MGGHPATGWHRFALLQRPSGLSRESAAEAGEKGSTGGCPLLQNKLNETRNWEYKNF